jgi:hypothetical protein
MRRVLWLVDVGRLILVAAVTARDALSLAALESGYEPCSPVLYRMAGGEVVEVLS